MKTKYQTFITLFLFALIVGFQGVFAEPQRPPEVEQAVYESIIRAIESEQIVSADPDIPVLTMLAEPEYTTGNRNVVYWDQLQGPLMIRDEQISLNHCIVEVQASLTDDFERTFDGHDAFPSAYADSLVYFGRDLNANALPAQQKIYYRARLWASLQEGPRAGGWSQQSVYSTQDRTLPTSESFLIDGVDSLAGNWFNQTQFQINYTLADDAGIYRACIWDTAGLEVCSTFIEVPDGTVETTKVSGTLPVELSNGDSRTFYLRGRDASYSHISHGAGEARAANWILQGNTADKLDSIRVNIDTKAPEIFFEERTYTGQDTTADGYVEIVVDVFDPLSGIDVQSLTARLGQIQPDQISIILPSDVPALTDTLTFTVRVRSDMDVKDSFGISVSDRAGNRSVRNRPVIFDLYAPELTAFTVSDLDIHKNICFAPQPGYTDSIWVLLYDFSFKDNAGSYLRITSAGQESVLPFDRDSVLFDLGKIPESGSTIQFRVTALDSAMNEQIPAITRSLIFDNMIFELNTVVSDANPFQVDQRNGAFTGWTNERIVNVTLESADDDLFKIKRLEPVPYCRELQSLVFSDSLPDTDNRQWTLSYKVSDFAGNVSAAATDTIKYDNRVAELQASRVIAFDISSGDTSSTGADRVGIRFQGLLDQIQDLSRIIVNDSLLLFQRQKMAVDADVEIFVPTGNGEFTVSCVDSAGNETLPIFETIPVIPRFDITLSDTSQKNKAQPGYTNEERVNISIINMNFDMSKADSFYFYNDAQTDVVVWDVNSEHNQFLIDLQDLYPELHSDSTYSVLAKVVLNNDYTSDITRDSIVYDSTPPAAPQSSLSDLNDQPFAARTGFSDSLAVLLSSSVTDNDVDSMALSNQIEFIQLNGSWTDVPAVS
ncbi:MAG: hypothetical protein U5R06_21900 [candidate division KSB1 bacterium]|nr:hypothetical protein [candidate division KSB1 bacterium]